MSPTAATASSTADDARRETDRPEVQHRIRELAREHAHVIGGSRRASPALKLRGIRSRLDQAWREFEASDGVESTVAEWLLDNVYLIAESIDHVREALPPGFVRWLPRLALASNERRIIALAEAILDISDHYVDPHLLPRLLRSYQEDTPLTTAELWALPAVLRLVVLDRLSIEAVIATRQLVTSSHASSETRDTGDEAGMRVGALVEDLRAFSVHDWKRYFEAVSAVEIVLRRDPSGVYSKMDFATRDRYRKVVEQLSRRSPFDEIAVAESAVAFAQEAKADVGPEGHVGYYLIDRGRSMLERKVRFRAPASLKLGRALRRAASFLYIGGIGIGSIGLAAIMARPAMGAGTAIAIIAVLLALLPASAVSVAFVNWVATRVVKPTPLPKLDPDSLGPAHDATVVAVPALLTSRNGIRSLIARLEQNYLANPDLGMRFALLADFVDAPAQRMPTDERLLRLAAREIRALNRRHASGPATEPFMLLYRERRWNPAQGCWMGWERKRGKLSQFNRLVLGDRNGMEVSVGDPELIRTARFAITLDADTVLPPEAAKHLIATASHPLNRPVFDNAGRITRGYSVLQPRVEVILPDRPTTAFARIFEGDQGLDLYSRAVSDVYQDLFAEGTYAGKGLYDIAAFERSVRARIPENALLSHDLFEGAHGRAALVSDVAVFEDYPLHVISYMHRVHRWIRGDWQIVAWLFPSVPGVDRPVRNRLSWLNRWKIADNLRRSLVEPAILVLLVAGWLLLPGSAAWWTGWAVAVLGLSFVLGTLSAARRRIRWPRRWVDLPAAASAAWTELARWGLSLALLPFRSLIACDAVVRTIARLIRRRNLLQWKSAAAVAQLVDGTRQVDVWRQMSPVPLLAAGLAAVIAVVRVDAAFAAAPLLLAWLASPWLAWRVSLPDRSRQERLSPDDALELRKIARATWGFFEESLTPNDHWLPVDHVQEDPHPQIARRTSPTNIGLGAAATLAAWDLGYVPVTRLTAILLNMFDSLDRLERHRGHFLNWYDTERLASLRPRYVSTVDSGNLAGALIAIARGCERIASEPLPRAIEMDGLRDTMVSLQAVVARSGIRAVPESQSLFDGLEQTIGSLSGNVVSPTMCGVAAKLALHDIPHLESLAADLAESAVESLDPRDLASLRAALMRARQHVSQCLEEQSQLMPWLELDEAPVNDDGARGDASDSMWRTLRAALPRTATLRDIPRIAERARDVLREIERSDGSSPAHGAQDAQEWIVEFAVKLETASRRAREIVHELNTVARRADAFVREMDFGFLYGRDRHLFHVGYNVDAGKPDDSYYDLLTSEARIASYVAIALGAVPAEHWLHLGRPFARSGRRALVKSWAGTMFEYLMPTLFLRTPDATLLAFACRAAIREQRHHAKRHGLPWGVSESAYHQLDRHGTYQYRAFGVAELALRRETARRQVIAPYASALALPTLARTAVHNLRGLAALGGLGRLGLYEAIDFGTDGVDPQRGGLVVRSHMAHHQAMILLAIDNVLTRDVMVRRFHADPRVAAVDHLLLERLPREARLETAPASIPRSQPRVSRSEPPRLWAVESDPTRPQSQVLSNGRWSTLITDSGCGGSRWLGQALTRWRADAFSETFGSFLYIQDLDTSASWSATPAPASRGSEPFEVLFGAERVEFRQQQEGLTTRLTVTVSPRADVEVRSLTITNVGERVRHLAVTSFAEVVLAPQPDDVRHPAFNKLFVESRYVAVANSLLFSRRHRIDGSPVHLAHTVAFEPGAARISGWETDRARFIGRRGSIRRPEGLAAGPKGLSRTVGSTLDPAFALGVEIELTAGAETTLTFLTSAAPSGAAALAQLDPFRSPLRVSWALREARDAKAGELGALRMSPDDAMLAQQLLSAIVFPYHSLRPEESGRGEARQNALWRIGVSGDLPVIAVRFDPDEDKTELSRLLRAHAFLRRQMVHCDLLILPGQGLTSGYADPLADWLHSTEQELRGSGAGRQSGGVFYVPASRLDAAMEDAIMAAAAVCMRADARSLRRLAEARPAQRLLPPFVPVSSAPLDPLDTAPLGASDDLRFGNGTGGFSQDGRQYIIRIDPDRMTPAPWINVVANPDFGFTVSETGGGFTWSIDSGRRRLTPWRNDPVLDTPGEVVYLRDEETGEVWSATPKPAPAHTPYEVRHSAGATMFSHRSHGLEQNLEMFVPSAAPVKITRLELTNVWPRPRRITVTCYAEWVLGSSRARSAPHVVSELAAKVDAVFARERFSTEYAHRVTFLAASERLHGATADRAEFLGEGGLEQPAGLLRIGLAEAFGSGLDPCAAVQIHLDMRPGEKRQVHFLIGDAESEAGAIELVRRFRSGESVASARAEVQHRWDDLLGSIRVDTPDPALDVMLNRWLPYQALSCRLWGRSALYQSSGAFGFRDQLQDALAFLMTRPALVRQQILESARQQFAEGDVLHWWHPGTSTGVRTRCSDDLLWLPFVTTAYVESTGDTSLLDEPVPFLQAAALAPSERERYTSFTHGTEVGTVFEHCRRALARGLTRGRHDLPLIGACDWNDGFDRVGSEGKGESVWLGWFLHAVLTGFAALCQRTNEGDAGAAFLAEAARLREALQAQAWDGEWYRRAYYDDGSPLGSAVNREARIDSISQSWAVLSGAAPADRARRAMTSLAEHLLDRKDRLLALLSPPFDRGEQQPGYIKAYPPGVRENGGQYTHAAVWAAWAFAQLGATVGSEDLGFEHNGEPLDPVELFRLLNPIMRARNPEDVARYRVEPYVVAADIYTIPPHTGRGGWTWYTGSAAWLYRYGIECVLGVQRRGDLLYVDPHIPNDWKRFSIRYTFGRATYEIRVHNPDNAYEGVQEVRLDGVTLDGIAIPLAASGDHEVHVRLGARKGRKPWSPVLW